MSVSQEQEFRQACKEDRHDIIDSMLANGYVPTEDDLSNVCFYGKESLMLKFLAYQHLDAQDGFMQAVYENHLHLLDYLYPRVDVRKPNDHGDTALHATSDIRVLKWLLDMGAKQMPNKDGNTPLHLACEFDFEDTVKLLLEHMSTQQDDALLRTVNKNKDTPLHVACEFGHKDTVKLLLEHMSSYQNQQDDQNQQEHNPFLMANEQGDTPLHIACWYKKLEIVRLLLQYMTGKQDHKALQMVNEDGDTPLKIVIYNKNYECAKLLSKYMVKYALDN